MNVALDTNILADAEGTNGAEKRAQALGELFNVLVRKAKRSPAAKAGCRLLLSEDLQEGFTWRGLSVTNPFASERHALLDALLRARKD